MANRRDFDHIGNYNFRVEIEGITAGAFRNVEGLESETEVVEFQDGADIVLRKRPGRTKYANIVLKKGYVATADLWEWRRSVIEGHPERKSGSVVLLGDDGQEELARYNFYEAWPAKWKGFSLDGKGTDVNVEEIELAVEKIEKG